MQKKNLIKRRFKNHILIFLIIFSLNSCSDKKNIVINKNIKTFSKFPKVEKLHFKKMFEFKEGIIGMLHIVDSTLIMLDMSSTNKYSIFNYSLKNGVISKRYLSRGRGPGEVLTPINIGITQNMLWVYDVTLKKIIVYDKLQTISNNSDVMPLKEYSVKRSFYTINLLDSLHYLGIGASNSDFKIQKMNLVSEKETDEFGLFEHIPDNLSIESAKQIYQSFIYLNPSGDRAVMPFRFIDAVEFFNLNTLESKLIHGIEGFGVDYKLVNGNMHRTDKTKHAFVGAAAVTNKYVYLLYSGSFDSSKNAFYGKQIYVYDWEGNPIKRLILNREVMSFTVSENDKDIYIYDANNGFIMKTNIE